MQDKYRSRKFIITCGCTVAAIAMAYFGKLDASLSNVLLAAMASYNMANAWSAK